MGSTFPRLKVWAPNDDIVTTDLNAEFDNILDNLTPTGVDDYSTNVAQMQATTDPGSTGSESLATSTAGEIERLRFMISQLSGQTQWYDDPAIDLEEANTLLALGQNIPSTRRISGRVRSGSSQPQFLQPDGTGTGFSLLGATDSFVCRIQGTEVTVSSDLSLSGLTLAPSSANTALVDDTVLAGNENTKLAGEPDADHSILTIDNVGSEIQSLVGKYASFKINNGVDDEFFYGKVASLTTLTNLRRGYFFDENDAPVPRITISNNDTITLLRTHWVFLQNDASTLLTSTNEPFVQASQPSIAFSGDFWFDLTVAENKWKRFNGSTWSDANVILLGIVACDDTNCIAVRSFDYFKVFSSLQTGSFERRDASSIRTQEVDTKISVYGTTFDFQQQRQIWSMATDLESGVSEAPSIIYYCYLTENGAPKISDVAPHARPDLRGRYHPHHTWRYLISITNDGSSNFGDLNISFSGDPAGISGVAVSPNFSATVESQTTLAEYASVELTTRGGPVLVFLTSSSTADAAGVGNILHRESGSVSNLIMILRRGTGNLATFTMAASGAVIVEQNCPVGCIQTVDFAPPGKHRYNLVARVDVTADLSRITEAKLMAVELGSLHSRTDLPFTTTGN